MSPLLIRAVLEGLGAAHLVAAIPFRHLGDQDLDGLDVAVHPADTDGLYAAAQAAREPLTKTASPTPCCWPLT